jgi:hypothetical protein
MRRTWPAGCPGSLSATAAERWPAVGSPAHGPDAPRRQRWHLGRGASSGAWKGCPAHVSAEPVGALFGRGCMRPGSRSPGPGQGRSPVMAGRPAGLLPKRLWLASGHDCEPGACRGQLITPDRDKDDAVFHRWHPALRRFPRRPAPRRVHRGRKGLRRPLHQSSARGSAPRPCSLLPRCAPRRRFRQKDRRRNGYQIQAHHPLPEIVSQEPAIGEVLALLA